MRQFIYRSFLSTSSTRTSAARVHLIAVSAIATAIVLSACSTPAAPAATTAQTEAIIATEAPAEATAVATTEATSAMTSTMEMTGTQVKTMTANVDLPAVNPGQVTGNINSGGSSTVGPLSIELASRFKQDGYAGEIKIDVIGSGAGIERFCRGEYDIANSSRAIKAAEIENCRAIGLEPLSLRVGTDALTIVVSRDNTFVDNLTREQLANIFSGKAKTWADVNPAWPAENIQLFSPGTDSGTFDYFSEIVFADEKDAEARSAIIPAVQGVQLSENDNVLVQGVEGSSNAIGYFGFAYFEENRDKLKAVTYEGIAPNPSTVASGDYGFSRPLFIITAPSILKEKPQVVSFVNYYMTNVDKVIKGVGYFSEPPEALNAAKQAFVDATK